MCVHLAMWVAGHEELGWARCLWRCSQTGNWSAPPLHRTGRKHQPLRDGWRTEQPLTHLRKDASICHTDALKIFSSAFGQGRKLYILLTLEFFLSMVNGPPQLGIEPRTFLLLGKSANHHTTPYKTWLKKKQKKQLISKFEKSENENEIK